MATIKAYSVSRTDGTSTASTVYSLGSGSSAPSTGRNGAYDHNDASGRTEGRTPTLVVNNQTITGKAAATPFSAQTAAGTALGDAAPASTTVVCTTTTLTGNGAGLIVKFDTTAAGAVAALATSPQSKSVEAIVMVTLSRLMDGSATLWSLTPHDTREVFGPPFF